MKIEYFPETDNLYIGLADRVETDSQEISDGIVLDLDADGHPIGIDTDQAAKHLSLGKLNLTGLPFEVEQVAV